MRNPIISAATDMANALGSLKFKRTTLRGTREGVEIHQPGKPVLLLTYDSARRFAQQIEEATNDD